jgi:ABC-type glycerol-3-phosphate transport system substrate-binding protein
MKRTALASLFALALAGAAHAEAPIGGGSATISGGGDNMTITYSTGGAGGGSAVHSQSGRVARFAGSNDGIQVEYLTPAPSNPGREAWLVGGGDGAEVVYVRPR